MRKDTITILGATGSVGLTTLKIIAERPKKYEIFALTAATKKEALLRLCVDFAPRFAVLVEKTGALWLQEQLKEAGNNKTQVLAGEAALEEVARDAAVDTVVAAIVGAAGARPAYAAALAGKKILLANKETLVMAGSLFTRAASASGALVLPLDSEHNAIFQALPSNKNQIQKIILTASGGPFLQTDPALLKEVSIAETLNHPRWKMGKKISVDSATMMNKALELIEAYWLFGLAPHQIEAVIHPQSVVHGLVRFRDETVLAVLGAPDMALPISFCLAYPERGKAYAPALDLTRVGALNFYAVDEKKFPALSLGYEVLQAGRDAGCVLNAANEVAVSLFLQGKIGYTDIVSLNREVLDSVSLEDPLDFAAVLAKDEAVRRVALQKARRFYRA